MRSLAAAVFPVLALWALEGCSRPTPAIDDAEAKVLGEVLASAGTSLDRVAVFDDLYDFSWRGAEEYALAHGLPEKAEKARKSRDDARDAVAIDKGKVVALRLAGSKLTALGPAVRLEHLVVLDLHDGQLADAAGLPALKELDHLGLAGNHLSTTAAVSNLPKLHSLYLANNPIGSMVGFHDLPELAVLNVASTQIAKMEGLAAVPSLRALSVEHTRVSHIEDLEAVPFLEDLNAAFCPIEKIENIGAAKHLKFLNLWHDQIRFIGGLEDVSPTVIYIGLGDNRYDWQDPENIRVLTKIAPGRIITTM